MAWNVSQVSGNGCRFHHLSGTHRQVQPIFDHVYEAVAEDHLHSDPNVMPMKIGQAAREMKPEHVSRADPDMATVCAVVAVYLRFQRVHLSQDPPRMTKKGSPLVGQCKVSGRASEQCHAELALQQVDPAADRNLVGHSFARDSGEGAAFGNSDEPAEPFDHRNHCYTL
ncbi:hypothetical protein D9M73_61700 [compost metagenome]